MMYHTKDDHDMIDKCLSSCNKAFDIIPQVAQAPLGTVNMTLHNSVIIRICMGI